MKPIQPTLRTVLLALLLIVLSPFPLAWGEPIVVAVIDSVFDYEHPALAPYMDFGNLISQEVMTLSGERKTLWSLNNEWIAEYRRVLAKPTASKVTDTMNRDRLEHGTHVAAIALEGRQNIRFIGIPYITSLKKFGLWDLIRFDPVGDLQKYRLRYQSIGAILESTHARVVNMSFGNSLSNSTQILTLKASPLARDFPRRIRQMARHDAANSKQAMEEFINAHPHIVFVMSAGNAAKVVSDDFTSSVKAPNLIRVAALTQEGELADFSNFSTTDVDVAAWGVDVESALIGGGTTKKRGTSMAAPQVTNRLLKLLEADPDLTAEELTARFYELETMQDTSLTKFIRGGRVLHDQRICPRIWDALLRQSGSNS